MCLNRRCCCCGGVFSSGSTTAPVKLHVNGNGRVEQKEAEEEEAAP